MMIPEDTVPPSSQPTPAKQGISPSGMSAILQVQQQNIANVQQLAELNAIYDTLPIGLCFYNTDLKYVRINKTLAEFNGVPVEDHLGRTPSEVLLPDLSATLEQLLRDVIETKRSILNREFYGGTPGQPDVPRLWLVNYVPVLDAAETVLGVNVMVQDITAARDTELELRKQKERFQLAVQGSDAGIWDWNILTGEDFFSDRWCELLGYAPDELTNHYAVWEALLHPDDRDRVIQAIEDHLRDRTPYHEEYRMRTKSGEYRWFFARGAAFCSEDGTPVRMAGSLTDINNRKQAELNLAYSEKRYRSLVETLAKIVWSTDAHGQFIHEQPAWTAFTGQSFEQYHKDWLASVHPDDREATARAWTHAIATQQPYYMEHRLRRHDGEYRLMSMRAVPVRDDSGVIQEWIGTHTDITKTHRQQLQLRDREERLQAALFAANTGTFRWDIPTGALEFDRALDRLFGLPKGQTLTTIHEFIGMVHPADRETVKQLCQRCAEEGLHFAMDYRVIHPDGSLHWISDTGKTFLDDQGKPAYMTGACIDITDRKRDEADRELLLRTEKATREELERANRLKDEFLAVLSHELRTPMNPILGWTQLLKTGRLLPERACEALATIERNAKIQVQLIDDLLDLSRVLQGKLMLSILPVDLTMITSAAIDTVRLSVDAKAIELRTEFDSKTCMVMGDAGRLQQVVWNLLSNAAKFTPEGGKIRVTLTQQTGKAILEIRDNGKGICSDFLPHLFEAFRQEDSSTTRKFGGLGLGLAIVKQIIAMHGGVVRADSAGEHQGSTFTIELPLVDAAPKRSSPIRSSTAPDLSHLRILVVDDTIDSLELAAFVLQSSGATVAKAASGAEAIAQFKTMQPDVLVVDIGMPDLDGYQLLQQLRSQNREASFKAIALTAYVSDTDQQRAIDAGYQKHVAKPLDPDRLIAAIVN